MVQSEMLAKVKGLNEPKLQRQTVDCRDLLSEWDLCE